MGITTVKTNKRSPNNCQFLLNRAEQTLKRFTIRLISIIMNDTTKSKVPSGPGKTDHRALPASEIPNRNSTMRTRGFAARIEKQAALTLMQRS